MAINERLIHTAGSTAAAGSTTAEQNLILHLDANDVDSYDGDGSIWYDISEHDVTIPLSDNADDLELHLNASDSTSVSGSSWLDISGNSRTVTSGSGIAAADFDKDNGGYWDLTQSTSEYFSVSHHDDLHPTDTGGNTFEFWVYPNGGNDTQMMAQKQNSNNFDYYINLHDSLGWELRLYVNGSQNVCRYNGDKTKGKWYHVVFTISSNVNPTVKLYLNGELKTTSNFTGTVDSNSDRPIEFGRYSTGNANDFNGRYGCVRYYSKALSASDIGQNYRHGRDYVYTDLAGTPFLHYDPADTNSYSGTGTTLTDLAGNNDGDLLGGIESSYDEELGNSFDITGSGDGITTKNTVSVNPATDGMTVEIWVYHRSNTQNYIFSFDGTNTTNFGMSYRTANNRYIWFYRNSGGGYTYLWSKAIDFNKWYHLTVTTDGASAQFYTNGELETDVSYPATTTDNPYNITYNEDLHFGNMYDLAQNTVTQIGQIRFYKGGLTQDQIRQNFNYTKSSYPNGYNASNTSNPPSWSVDYFQFDRNSITSGDQMVFDSSFNSALSNLSEYTFTAWYYPDNLSGRNTIFGAGHTSDNNDWAIFRVRDNGNAEYSVQDAGTNAGVTFIGAAGGNDNWHFIAFTVDSSGAATCRRDGNNYSPSYNSGSSVRKFSDVDFNTVTIGSLDRGSSGQYYDSFDGRIGQIRLYDRVLTTSEIDAIEALGR